MDTGGLLKAWRPVLFCLLLAAMPVQARVFTRTTIGKSVTDTLEAFGGTTAYTAPLRLNKGDGTLRVIGFDDSLATVASQIRTALRLPATPATGLDSLHTLRHGDTVTRLLLLHMPTTGQTLAVSIEQSLQEYHRSRLPPSRHLLTALPAFPGATPGFFAENRDTGLRLATLTADAQAPTIAAFYNTRLAVDGWQPVFPSADPGAALFFLRANALCFVLISPAENQRGQHITLLHKTLESVKP